MEKEYEKKITWTIKNFTSLQSKKIYSDHFVVGDSKWRLVAYPKGNRDNDYLSLYLDVADSESLPHGWKRHAKFRLTVVNQTTEKLSHHKANVPDWFDHKSFNWGYRRMIPLTKLLDKIGGFLVNGEVKIVAEVVVLEIIGKSEVLHETSLVNESSLDVNGFQVLPSQVESVSSLFEKHPDIASKFSPMNQLLRTTYMNSLLSLNEILSHPPEELSIVDLANAYATLSYVTQAGFKLDWLEKKLKEFGKTRVQEIEEELKNMKQKCTNMEALLEFLQ